MATRPLRIATDPGPMYAPQHVAEASGAFEAHGLTVEFLPTAGFGMLDMLCAGDADLALGTVWFQVLGCPRSPDLEVVLQSNQHCHHVLVAGPDRTFAAWEELGATTIAVPIRTPTPWTALGEALQRHGVDDANRVPVADVDTALDLLDRGVADLVLLAEHEAVLRGRTSVLTIREAVPLLPWSVYVTTPTFAREASATIGRLADALAQSMAWMADVGTEEVSSLLAGQFPNLERSRLHTIVETYLRADLWPRDPQPQLEPIRQWSQVLRANGLASDGGTAAP